MNVCFCDGGLANRLNGLLFALILRSRFGHDWQICWPPNNWCEARFATLFEIDLPVIEQPLQHFVEHQDAYRFLVHEVQGAVDPSSVVLNATLDSYDAYAAILAKQPVCYMNNLVPAWVPLDDAAGALAGLRVRPQIVAIADRFCRDNGIDDTVLGLHIRKTDFGDSVNDAELFELVSRHSGRFFVCTDDAGVSNRFAGLDNCHVFEKSHYPSKLQESGGWNHWITDAEGRAFPFNIRRSEEAIVEALVDLLVLSRCTPVRASQSTFFQMALLFRAANFMGQQLARLSA